MSFLLLPPSSIEGIGTRRGQKLRKSGIANIAQMFVAGAPKVHSICNKASPTQVGSWFCAAMLLRVDDMTPDLAEALVDGGIRSVSKLADSGLRTVELAVKSAVEHNKVRAMPSLYALASLQRNAWNVRERGMLTGRVLNRKDRPVKGVTVQAGRFKSKLDKSGWFAFDHLPEGASEIEIKIPNRRDPLSFKIKPVLAARLLGPEVFHIDDSENALSVAQTDEFSGEIFTSRFANRNRLVNLELNRFPDGTYFLVRQTSSDNSFRLLNLFKKRIGQDVIIERATVDKSALPDTSGVGDVVVMQDRKLVATSLTSFDVALLKRKKWAKIQPVRTRRVITATGGV